MFAVIPSDWCKVLFVYLGCSVSPPSEKPDTCVQARMPSFFFQPPCSHANMVTYNHCDEAGSVQSQPVIGHQHPPHWRGDDNIKQTLLFVEFYPRF